MPEGFNRCVRTGGKVRRMVGPSKRFGIKKGEYRNICYKGGKTWQGHKHKKKKK